MAEPEDTIAIRKKRIRAGGSRRKYDEEGGF
jgi:hypothetical protein